MMARSTTRSNLRPDTLMQDRRRQFDEIVLQRTAGPYIGVNNLGRTHCEQMSSGLPLKADIARCSRHVAFVSSHKVAALQPAAREQEPRGRHPVERTAMAGWQGHVLSACNAWSRTARIIWQAGTLMRRVTSTPPYDKVLLTNSANQFA